MPTISFHEQQHINRLIQQEGSIKYIFDSFVRKVGIHLSAWKDTGTGGVWGSNKVIEKRIRKELDVLHQKLVSNIEQYTTDAWNRSHLKTDELISSYVKGLAISKVAKDGMLVRNSEALKTFLSRKVDGLTLSDRVWNIREGARTNIEFYLESGLATGRSSHLISQDIRQLLNDPDRRFHRVRNSDGKLVPSAPMKDYKPGTGKYRSSYKNALRLAATNTNEIYRLTDCERWSQLDFVLGIEIKRSGSGNSSLNAAKYGACSICDPLVGKYPKNFVFKGWHPWCICYATPILMNQDEFIERLTTDDFTSPKGLITDLPRNSREYFNNAIEQGKISSKSYLLIDNSQYFDQAVKVGGKGSLNIVNGVDRNASDYKSVFASAKWFAENGHAVEILPRYHLKDKRYKEVFGKLSETPYEGKSPDLLIDEKFYEHEGFRSKNPKRNLSNMLNRGLKQSPRLIIEDCGLTDRYIKRILFNRKQKGQLIDELWILSNSGKLRKLL